MLPAVSGRQSWESLHSPAIAEHLEIGSIDNDIYSRQGDISLYQFYGIHIIIFPGFALPDKFFTGRNYDQGQK